VHLVGFIIRIYHDARFCECQTDGKKDKLKETKTRKKIREGKNRNGERTKKEWEESDIQYCVTDPASQNNVKANYGDMKKWK
jgi:hypothetical protein